MTDFEIQLLGFFFFLASFVSFSVLMYISIRHLDRIESLLSNSRFVMGNREVYSRAGLLGRAMRICTIATMLVVPRVFAWRGLVDLQQVTEFPRRMRCVLMIAWWGAVISLIAFGSIDYLELLFRGG
ncbi:hypothetical protein [Pseudomonas sp.]|uniref:hypothetical protein n=1 Tax=Pseudomonas sp. TaxID=306 RepID=UPI0031D46C6F